MQLYVNGLSAIYEYIDDTNLWLYIDNFQESISSFNYYASASIDTIIPDSKTIKNVYPNLTQTELDKITDMNYDYKLR
jgi:hypothetical protein